MIENISIDSGGVYGFSYLGSLKFLYEKNLINNLKNILGSSIGSLIGLMICLKFTIDEMIQIGKHIDLDKLINLNNNFLDIGQNFGYDAGEKIEKIIKIIIFSKLKNNNITFKELYEMNNINLIVVGSNLTQNKVEYFNKDNFPDMYVWKAVRISCNIPLIFSPYKYKDNYYTDGYLNNCSTNYFNKQKKSVGLSVINYYDIECDFNTFNSYLSNLIFYPIKQIKSQNLNNNNMIDLSNNEFKNLHFYMNIDDEKKQKLINDAYLKTKNRYNQLIEYLEINN